MKDFAAWHKAKSQINNADIDMPFFYEKDIWWVSIGLNVRFEEDGKGHNFARPVLVLRKFNRYLFYGVPLSTTQKRGEYYHPFRYEERTESVALLSQMRSYDSKRLIDKAGVISEEEYRVIQQKITRIINKESVK